eukprot:scaffold1505_cov256-Pinguiococcus_pyrenoidosus.AAC.22
MKRQDERKKDRNTEAQKRRNAETQEHRNTETQKHKKVVLIPSCTYALTMKAHLRDTPSSQRPLRTLAKSSRDRGWEHQLLHTLPPNTHTHRRRNEAETPPQRHNRNGEPARSRGRKQGFRESPAKLRSGYTRMSSRRFWPGLPSPLACAMALLARGVSTSIPAPERLGPAVECRAQRKRWRPGSCPTLRRNRRAAPLASRAQPDRDVCAEEAATRVAGEPERPSGSGAVSPFGSRRRRPAPQADFARLGGAVTLGTSPNGQEVVGHGGGRAGGLDGHAGLRTGGGA